MSSSDPNSFAVSTPVRGGVGLYNRPSVLPSGLASHLYSGASWSAFGTGAVVSYAYRDSGGTAQASGFSRFNTVQMAVTEGALQAWSDVAGIRFERVQGPGGYSSDATILFGNYSSGLTSSAGFASYPGSMSPASSAGDVWINANESYNASPALINYGSQVLVHEIGHAIGLSHPSHYDGGNPSYLYAAEYVEDSRRYSVMSYFSETNTGGNYRGAYSAVPMLDDIFVIQQIYGVNGETRTGDTIYGFHSNADRDWFSAATGTTPLVFAVWDAGGRDTFDFSGYDQNQYIDLREGAFSDVGGLTANVAIAYGAAIENAIGGTGRDTIVGNGFANLLDGGPGGDFLYGEGGDDILIGGDGDDLLDGGSGSNRIDGGAGTDTILLPGVADEYEALPNADGSWSIYRPSITDRVSGVERVQFGSPTGARQAAIDFTAYVDSAFPALRYVASHTDLIRAIGADPAAARRHYEQAGRNEGRTISFDPWFYGASNPDVVRGEGTTPLALEAHYIRFGFGEGRATASFDPLLYAASNADLARAIGVDRAALTRHYVQYGVGEKRPTSGFDALRYAASNADLYKAMGADVEALTGHYLTYGAKEGRSTAAFDPLRYAASNADVALALGADRTAIELHYLTYGRGENRALASFDPLAYAVANRDVYRAVGLDADALSTHYIAHGIKEGRSLGSFDPYLYGASNPDVARANGADPTALTRHYLTYGVAERRPTASFDPLQYAAANADVARANGLDPDRLATHYIRYGLAEGRPLTGFDPLRYVASNPDLVRVFGADTGAAFDHYLRYGVYEGRSATSFDPLRYAASNTDLIGRVPLDARSLETHYILSGAAEGRSTTRFDPVAYLLSTPAARGPNGVDGAMTYYLNGDYRTNGNPNGRYGTEQTVFDITSGQAISGRFETVGDRDWYRFTLNEPASVVVETRGSTLGFDTELAIFNQNGTQIYYNDDGAFDRYAGSAVNYDTFRGSNLTMLLNTGTFYISAMTKNDALSGAYTVSLRVSPLTFRAGLEGEAHDAIAGAPLNHAAFDPAAIFATGSETADLADIAGWMGHFSDRPAEYLLETV